MKHTTTLARLRPPTPELDPAWSAHTLASITSGRGSHPFRWGALSLATAAAAAAAVVVVPGIGSGDAVAADLRALSLAAVDGDGPVLREGTWLHEQSTSVQRNGPATGEEGVLDTRRETWTSWDGRVLLVEQRPSAGWTTYDVLDDAAPASYQDPTPAFAETLPDDAAGLRAYLDPRVFGSTSHAEALFSALTGLATSHTLPPATLAATYEALADVENVTTTDVAVGDRPAVEISYDEESTSSTQSITVDRGTGQVLAMDNRGEDRTYTSATTLSEVVDAVPAQVRSEFRTHEEGVRYPSA